MRLRSLPCCPHPAVVGFAARGRWVARGILKQDPDASVLVVSALDQQQVLKDAIKLGASDFIVKPFDKDCLTGALDKLVESK
ncbi:MAG: response regulator [Fuerstiella sp.]|nr:response regulator [Fuerstiella sp.]MCP4854375.1 response regulator [Fuerstiella sp.]